MSNGKSRRKGRDGELEVVHLIPGAKRVGYSFIKTIIDIDWPDGVAQVKNLSIGGTAMADILADIAKSSPKKGYVIFKAKRGTWLICQSLKQFLGG